MKPPVCRLCEREHWSWQPHVFPGFAGKRIRGALDGKVYIEVDDEHIGGSGRVGVWTKADSVTLFDDFNFRGTPSR